MIINFLGAHLYVNWKGKLSFLSWKRTNLFAKTSITMSITITNMFNFMSSGT